MLNDVVQGKSTFVRLGDEMIGQLTQVSLAFATIGGFVRPRRDESPDAATRFDDAVTLQLGIDLRDCVRIDAQLDRQLPDGRQLVANAQFAGGNGKPNRPVKLVVNRRRMLGIDLEHLMFTHCTTTMEQVKLQEI